MPKTLTDAINAQPAPIHFLPVAQTVSNVREVPYEDVYRESTAVRETPVQRLQRITASAQ